VSVSIANLVLAALHPVGRTSWQCPCASQYLPFMSLSFFCAALLDLSFNSLTGPIPTELGLLTGLEYLGLGKFATISSSELDTIRLLASFLQFISSTVVVVINQLTGPIPTELARLTSLRALNLGKFATISSSELDTIALLGSLSYNLSRLLLL
jgi:hypothetical protein